MVRCFAITFAKAILLLELSCLPAIVFAQGCVEKSTPAGTTSRTIHLSGKTGDLSFYYRTEGYVVFIPPDVLAEDLDDIGLGPIAERLKPQIVNRIPLAQNQDLFQFELTDWLFWGPVRALVMHAIETGKASIMSEGGIWLDDVRIVHVRRHKIADTVVYADQKGRTKIIWKLDCIVD
jgi:hypothetical protein